MQAFIAAPNAEQRAGYFALALDDPAPAARRLERLVAWRCRWLALPYGDQGLLIHHALYDAAGGYAAIPLMEDVDLVRRLGRVCVPANGLTRKNLLGNMRATAAIGYKVTLRTKTGICGHNGIPS